MGKRFLLILLCGAVVFCLTACYVSSAEQEEYFYQINKIIRDEDFCTAKAKNGKIVLFDSLKNPIKEIPFAEYDKNITFLYARKEGALIYFVTSRAVDDEHGILFVNDGADDFLGGIHSIKRVGGNAYEYDTAK